MADEKTVPVDSTQEPVAPVEKKDYSKDFVDKLMREKNNWREKAMKEEESRKRYEEEKMLAESRFKDLAEIKEKEALDWKAKYESTQKVIVDSVKINGVKKELQKLGIGQNYMEHAIKSIDLSTIKLDPDTNTLYGHDTAANQIKEMFPPLFGNTTARVDHSAPNAEHKTVDIDTWKSMPHDDKLKYEEELYKSLGIVRKH